MLTADEKNVLIESIVTNCKCNDEDRKVLNSLSDETLMAVTLNAMPMEKKKKPAPVQVTVTTEGEEEEDTEEETPVANHNRPMTEKQFMSILPPSMREDMLIGRRAKIARRDELISQLVANVGEEEKQEKAELLVNESIERLEFLAGLLPTADSQSSAQLVNYHGLPGAYVRNSRKQVVKPDDVMVLPTVNFATEFGSTK